MSELLINLTNHPSEKWSEEQKGEAYKLIDGGDILDWKFPMIPSGWGKGEVVKKARKDFWEIREAAMTGGYKVGGILVQGEMTYVYAFVREAEQWGIKCYAACSERVSEESRSDTTEGGSVRKVSVFKFVRFREY